MTNQTPDSALDDAERDVFLAVYEYRAVSSKPLHDGQFLAGQAAKQAVKEAIKAYGEARYEAGRRDALQHEHSDGCIGPRLKEHPRCKLCQKLATPTMETKP